MGKIVFYVPNPESAGWVQEIFDRENDGSWELDIRFTTGVREIAAADIQADVVIARGVTGYAAKQLLKDMPVIMLPITGYDILRALLLCREKFAAAKLLIVGPLNMVCGADILEAFAGVEIRTLLIADEEDGERKIREAQAEGFTTLIGGGTASLIAKSLGMNSVMIHSGEEAILQALREAMQVAVVKRQEQEIAEQFRAILDYSLEGIIAVDEDGRISLVNRFATEIAGVGLEQIGQAAEKLIPQLRMTDVLRSGQAEVGFFEKVGNRQVAVNCVPIILKNRPVGAVATFQPITAIQELESKYRSKLHRRGLVAKLQFGDILTQNPRMCEIVNLAIEYSAVDSNVLLLGETGVGKEVFAQGIHNASSRRNEPFVAVNCAALPENLLESQLFGYVEGAFTGASRGGKMGLFEQAHRGTIFLDEIAEISPKIQGHLLRVLQEREIMRLGDDRVIPVDVRVIAATNKKLSRAMQEGHFRSDLFYRLDVLTLEIPPLRERSDDILLMLEMFMQRYAIKFHKCEKKLSPSARRLLKEYSWPGNVRELRNIAERLTVLNRPNDEMVDEVTIVSLLSLRSEAVPPVNSGRTINGFKRKKLAAQQEMIEKLLGETKFDYDKTAQALGISRTTLWRRLKGNLAEKQ